MLDVARAAGMPLVIVSAILAAIYFGVTTPSEGGAIGVCAIVLLGLATRKLDGRNLRQAMEVAGILCSGIILLLLGASFFILVFRGLEGHLWIESLFGHLPAGQTAFIVFVNLAIFLLAFFLDFFEIAFTVVSRDDDPKRGATGIAHRQSSETRRMRQSNPLSSKTSQLMTTPAVKKTLEGVVQ